MPPVAQSCVQCLIVARTSTSVRLPKTPQTVRGQHGNQVTTLTGAEADHSEWPGRGPVERLADPQPHCGQPPGERGVRSVVVVMPGVPVPGHRHSIGT